MLRLFGRYLFLQVQPNCSALGHRFDLSNAIPAQLDRAVGMNLQVTMPNALKDLQRRFNMISAQMDHADRKNRRACLNESRRWDKTSSRRLAVRWVVERGYRQSHADLYKKT